MSQSSIIPSELRHYGVKGMKWGVRKDENSKGNADSDRAAELLGNAYAYKHYANDQALRRSYGVETYGDPLLGRDVAVARAKRMLKKLRGKYDSVVEKHGHDIETGQEFVSVVLTKDKTKYETRAEIYEKSFFW